MSMDDTENIGYVYILEVSDIDLPVCKIGQTSRSPNARCAEINKSSTGDFLWQVAHEFPVNDRKRFERIVHKKLEPLRQKNREFFNVTADVASNAVQSILDAQSEIKAVDPADFGERPMEPRTPRKTKKSGATQFRQEDSKYADILALFAKTTECKGRSFGQLNKPFFGMSDGKEGVQWNIVIHRETQEIKLGVNLEGKKYINWPIATFILNELRTPGIEELKKELEDPGRIIVRFLRDAWQVTSRPFIEEELIQGREFPISEIDSTVWHSMLGEALECLSEATGYRGRSEQVVTLVNQPKRGSRTRSMEVSPHLIIWTPVNCLGDAAAEIEVGVNRLKPIHEWVSRVSQ
jgi:hypothetical protein